MFLRQSTTQTVRFGPFLDSTDFITAETALTIAQADMQLSKDGGAFAQKNAAGNATHDTDGWYSTSLNATDTATVGELYMQVVVSGALPVWVRWWVLEEVVYDDIYGASAAGPAVAGDAMDLVADAVDAASVATGAIDADAIASNAITAAKIATDAITADKIAANAIGASELATDAIGSDQLAATAVNEIADGVWDEDIVAAHGTGDTAGDILSNLTGKAATLSTDVVAGSIVDQILDDGTATYDRTTDSLQALRDRGDAAWTTGAGGTPPQLLQNTTIATLASQTSFTLTAGSADDDAYNDAIIVVTDQSTSTQKAVGSISDYTGSTRTVTLSADPGIFTMAVGDTVDIIAALGSAGSAPTAVQIRQEMDSNSTQLAAIVADTNELQTDDVPGLIAALNDPTAATIADAVWDEARSGHTTAGSFGQGVASVQGDVTGNVDGSTASVTAGVTVTTNNDKSDYTLSAAGISSILTTQMTESYNADGVAPTLAQALFGIFQQAGEFAISGTTISVKRLDGSTEAMTFTLDDATNPTSRTRAT